MRNKWLIGGLVVVIVAIALVGGQLLMTQRSATSGADVGASIPDSAGSSSTSSSGQDTTAASGSGSAAQPKAPTTPAAAGETLKALAAPPAAIVGGFSAGFLPPGSRYTVTVQPYGFGPSLGNAATLAVRITAAKGIGSAPEAQKLVGRNALVTLQAGAASAWTTGGSFSAELMLKPDPRGSVLVLSTPKPKAPSAAK